MKYIYMDFPNGEVYRLPAKFVAEERARYYAEKDYPDDVEKQKEAKRVEVDHALSYSAVLFDYFRGNLSWEDDIRPKATRVQGPQPFDKTDFYNDADLRLKDVDPSDDPDKPDRTPPGIYLLNATGDLAPLATEAGDGDRDLLREALSEHDATDAATVAEHVFVVTDNYEPTVYRVTTDRPYARAEKERFGGIVHEADVEHGFPGTDEPATRASEAYPDVADFVVDLIEDREDGEGAPVAEVINATAEEFAFGSAIDVVRDLHANGDVYGPTKTTLRTTGE